MCELLGMSANVPTDICFSFTGLIERGGGTGPHRDGWGVAFYLDGRGRTIHEPYPGIDSQIADMLKRTAIKSHIVISHIRQANVGEVSLVNTHPFTRMLWDASWTFAHNGQLSSLHEFGASRYRAIGTTDSEQAFCWLLDRIASRFPEPPADPGELYAAMQQHADRLREHGVFNMLLTDARRLYAYCGTSLCWITRRAPFGEAHLKDTELAIDFHQETTDRDVVTVVATAPLTDDEAWTAMQPGELCVFEDGELTRLAPH